MLGGCSRSEPPNLFDSPTLIEKTSYSYRIPIGGCARPIVHVNGRNWEPDAPWPGAPFPENWHVTDEGPKYHHEQYLVGRVRLERDRLVISLPDGTVVKRYHPTTDRQALCA